MGLGFEAGGETVRVENGDGGRDGDSLRFYMAITLPQMPLSEIDGVVNLFSTRRVKEISNFQCVLARLLVVVLSRDQNLFHVLIGNDYDKMLLT